MTDIYTNMDELIALSRRKIELLIEFKKALRLADLVGIPPKELKQKVSTTCRHTGGGSTYNPTPWKHMVFSVRVGDDGWQDFPLTEVHHDLWPADMQQAYTRWHNRRVTNATQE